MISLKRRAKNTIKLLLKWITGSNANGMFSNMKVKYICDFHCQLLILQYEDFYIRIN